jgi:uncharacterized membrane protein
MSSPVTITDQNNLPVIGMGVVPSGVTQITGTSGNIANNTALATLVAVAGKTAYLTGFDITGSGAVAGLPVVVTMAGLLGGSLTFTYTASAGSLVANQPLSPRFNPPLPASAANTNITVSCAALGAGATNNVVNAYGFNA